MQVPGSICDAEILLPDLWLQCVLRATHLAPLARADSVVVARALVSAHDARLVDARRRGRAAHPRTLLPLTPVRPRRARHVLIIGRRRIHLLTWWGTS